MNEQPILFVGGGNMAGALIGGLVQTSIPGARLVVIDPNEATRERLVERFGVRAMASAEDAVRAVTGIGLVVWAVKPQSFTQAAMACGSSLAGALHLSVMAGIRSDAIARATGSPRVVRTMPNTPALIGRGITGLFARDGVDEADRALAETVLRPTGELCWVSREADLDAVTALSGSGPAYVFYFVEAMMQAAVEMGLTEAQGRQLALATFSGATALAQQSDEAPSVLRERVTSKGGTTHAALTAMETSNIKGAFIEALKAAQRRAKELGDEFGG